MLGGQGGDVAGDVTGTERGAASGTTTDRTADAAVAPAAVRSTGVPPESRTAAKKFSAGRSGRQLSRPGQCPQPAWLCRKGYHDACRRIRRSNLLTQYGRLRCLQFRSWLDAQFVGESGPGRRVDIECFCLAARCRESAHEQGVRSLTVRVCSTTSARSSGTRSGGSGSVSAAVAQFGPSAATPPAVGLPLGRTLRTRDRPGLGLATERAPRQQPERRFLPGPGPEGRVRPGQEPLELVQVHGFPGYLQEVTRWGGQKYLVGDDVPQVGDVDVPGRARRSAAVPSPHRASISRSTATTRPAFRVSSASRARRRALPSDSGPWSSSTWNRPRTRNHSTRSRYPRASVTPGSLSGG